jgi:hypothetical protein
VSSIVQDHRTKQDFRIKKKLLQYLVDMCSRTSALQLILRKGMNIGSVETGEVRFSEQPTEKTLGTRASSVIQLTSCSDACSLVVYVTPSLFHGISIPFPGRAPLTNSVFILSKPDLLSKGSDQRHEPDRCSSHLGPVISCSTFCL